MELEKPSDVCGAQFGNGEEIVYIDEVCDLKTGQAIVSSILKTIPAVVAVTCRRTCKGDPETTCSLGAISLMLVAVKGHCAIFDILGNPALVKNDCLDKILENRDVLKVMHDCSYDSFCLYNDFGVLLTNVFDVTVGQAALDSQASQLCVKDIPPRHIINILQEHDKCFPIPLGSNIYCSEKNSPKMWEGRPLNITIRDYLVYEIYSLLFLTYPALIEGLHPISYNAARTMSDMNTIRLRDPQEFDRLEKDRLRKQFEKTSKKALVESESPKTTPATKNEPECCCPASNKNKKKKKEKADEKKKTEQAKSKKTENKKVQVKKPKTEKKEVQKDHTCHECCEDSDSSSDFELDVSSSSTDADMSESDECPVCDKLSKGRDLRLVFVNRNSSQNNGATAQSKDKIQERIDSYEKLLETMNKLIDLLNCIAEKKDKKSQDESKNQQTDSRVNKESQDGKGIHSGTANANGQNYGSGYENNNANGNNNGNRNNNANGNNNGNRNNNANGNNNSNRNNNANGNNNGNRNKNDNGNINVNANSNVNRNNNGNQVVNGKWNDVANRNNDENKREWNNSFQDKGNGNRNNNINWNKNNGNMNDNVNNHGNGYNNGNRNMSDHGNVNVRNNETMTDIACQNNIHILNEDPEVICGRFCPICAVFREM